MATIKEVAERAQVSTATVSYVLNGTGSVTEATRQRVLTAVAELDYQPNYAARSMRGRSHTLGLVLPALATRLTDPLLSELLAGFSEAAAARGYYLLLATATEEQPEQLLAAQFVRTGRVDGVVLLDVQTADERVAYLVQQGIPHVCAGPPPEGHDVPYVTVDGCGGVLLAMRHLLGLGHRRIALIMLPSDLATSEPHYQGYSAALTAAGIAVDPTLILETGRTQIDGVTAMQELLDLPEPPTAVLACSDEVAFGAMHALHTAGREVGRDVSLVGFDDVPMAAHTHPPLTTLHYPQRDLGLHLARLLIGRIEGHTRNQQSVTLEMNLIIRKSTGPVPVGDQG
jgi:DNA-binding LacI/PurR family transcriptional regulator